MDGSALVSTAEKIGSSSTARPSPTQELNNATIQAGPSTPDVGKDDSDGLSIIRKTLKNGGFQDDTINIILASWRPSTKRQYKTYLQKWIQFCNKKTLNPCAAEIRPILAFLTDLYKNRKLHYSALNTARSAISTFMEMVGGKKVGEHFLIVRFMKGVFNHRPSLPRYTETWDPQQLLGYLRKLSPSKKLSLKLLTYKSVTLLTLLSGQRVDNIH